MCVQLITAITTALWGDKYLFVSSLKHFTSRWIPTAKRTINPRWPPLRVVIYGRLAFLIGCCSGAFDDANPAPRTVGQKIQGSTGFCPEGVRFSRIRGPGYKEHKWARDPESIILKPVSQGTCDPLDRKECNSPSKLTNIQAKTCLQLAFWLPIYSFPQGWTSFVSWVPQHTSLVVASKLTTTKNVEFMSKVLLMLRRPTEHWVTGSFITKMRVLSYMSDSNNCQCHLPNRQTKAWKTCRSFRRPFVRQIWKSMWNQ